MELMEVLQNHGINVEPSAELYDCSEAADVVGGMMHVSMHDTLAGLVAGARRQRLAVVVTHVRKATDVVRALHDEGVVVGVLVYDPEGQESGAAALRAGGVMDVLTSLAAEDWAAVVERAVDYRRLLLLELDHRCESKRLAQRELELLGEPPESLSDDLDIFQPPPLPVGPLSIYDLDQASEAFETAYIERVQHLCSSAREAAQVLGVSPATLSRRQRKDGE